ncbi:MAG: signal peptidase I [Oscillospiraceae bacterium]|nr:signal peptidase I [Oscillospiraceae bacterium]
MLKQKKQVQESKSSNKLLTVIGTILCLILTPILIINLTLIVKSYTNADEVPSVGGHFPLIVLTDSMYPVIHSGDLIFCETAEAEEIAVDDVICFFDPAGNGTTIVTHRVLEIVEQDGEIAFRTKGDNNNTEDRLPVPADSLVGVYRNRVAGLGHVALFMQSPTGLIVCVVLPIILLVAYDMIRRRRYEKRNQDDTAQLLEELERLRAEKAAQETNSKN